MTAGNKRSNRDGIFLDRVIACPVCGEKAHSFRIRRVISLRTVDGEFYHRTATCTGSMTPDMPTAMDLLRLAVEEVAKRPELGFRLMVLRRRISDLDVAALQDGADEHSIAWRLE